MIKIVGTSHIAKQSVDEIKKMVSEWQPDFVCVELDQSRLYALFHGKQKLKLADMKQLGVFGWFFVMVGSWLQKYLGKKVGFAPGIDMKTAVLAAQKNKARIVLIDQPINITIRKINKISLKEKLKLGLYLLFGWALPFERKMLKKINLRKVPDDKLVNELTSELRRVFPEFAKVLIDDRNKVMIKKLKILNQRFPDSKILVVIGAGHVAAFRKTFR